LSVLAEIIMDKVGKVLRFFFCDELSVHITS